MIRPAVLTVAGMALAGLPALAAGAPTGPAASAVQQWFTSDRHLGCVNQDGGDVACGSGNEPSITMLYGNADGGAGTPDAAAFVTYLTDPTGNGQSVAAASFHWDGDGLYRFNRRLYGLEGEMVAPGSRPRWGSGKVAVTMVVLKPTDSRCCPTGRKVVSLQVR